MKIDQKEVTIAEADIDDFLAQFPAAKKSISEWPKWMQDATRTASASFPKRANAVDITSTENLC